MTKPNFTYHDTSFDYDNDAYKYKPIKYKICPICGGWLEIESNGWAYCDVCDYKEEWV